MPVTIKAGAMKIKDPDSGTYRDIDAVAELTASQQIAAIQAAGAGQVSTVNAAGDTQTSLVNAAGDTQIRDIEDKGQETLASIPDDYTSVAETAVNAEHYSLSAYQVKQASGSIVEVTDGKDDIPIENLTVNIEPVQSGSGDPSLTNVRPISGWNGVNIFHKGKNLVSYQRAKANTTTVTCSMLHEANGIRVVGPANQAYAAGIISNFELLPGVTYTLSADVVVNSGNGNARIAFRDGGTIKKSTRTPNSGHYSVTYTVPYSSENWSLCFFASYSTAEDCDVEFHNIQLELWDAATEFEPFIKSDNLIDEKTAVFYQRNIPSNYVWQEASDSRSFAIPCVPNAWYYIETTNPEIDIFRAGYLTVDASTVASGESPDIFGGTRLTAPGYILVHTGPDAKSIVVQIKRVIAETRNTGLKIELVSSTYYYDFGEVGTIYGGTVDVSNGIITVDRKVLTFDGVTDGHKFTSVSTYNTDSTHKNAIFMTNAVSDVKVNPGHYNLVGVLSDKFTEISNAFAYSTLTEFMGVFIYEASSTSIIRLSLPKSLGILTAAQCNQWIQDNGGFEIVYPLNESVAYPIGQTISDIKIIPGTNVVWADTGDVELEYRVDANDCVEDAQDTLSTLYETALVGKNISGSIVHFDDGAKDIPIKRLSVDITPVQSGSGDPAPDNVRPIAGWDGVTLTSSGKNVANYKKAARWSESNTDLTVSILDDGVRVTLSEPGANISARIPLPYLKPGKRYVARAHIAAYSSDSVSGYPQLAFRKLNDNYIVGTAGSPDTNGYAVTAITAPDTPVALCLFVTRTDADVGDYIFDEISVEQLDSGYIDEYVPFDDSKSFNIIFQHKAGTVYGGTLDVTTGELTVTYGRAQMGSANGSFAVTGPLSVYPNTYAYTCATLGGMIVPNKTTDVTNILCSHLPSIARQDAAAQGGSHVGVFQYQAGSDNQIRFAFPREDAYSSKENVMAYFDTLAAADTPFTVVYPLVNPAVFHLSPIEVKTLLGINNIWADTGDVSVEYRADTHIVINETENDLNSKLNKIRSALVSEISEGVAASFTDGSDGLAVNGITVDIEPVQLGSGDPAPDNVRPISGWTGVTLEHRNKNLLPAITGRTHKGINFSVNDDGSVTCDGIATEAAYTSAVFVGGMKPGTYKKSPRQNGVGIYVQYRITSDTWSTVTGGASSSDTFTLDADKLAQYPVVFRIHVLAGTDLTTPVTYYPYVFLDDGTEPTWVSPKSSTRYISFPADPGTVYGGTLDVTNGVLTVDGICKTLTGTESISLSTSGYRRFLMKLNSNAWPANGDISKTISSHFTRSTSATQETDQFGRYRVSADGYLVLLDNGVEMETIDALKAWLADQITAETPVQFWYALAEPVTYQLTPTEVETLLGVNNIWADTGDINVNYIADTKMYIAKQIAQLQALVLEN